jgi:hypothetical protein
MRPIVLLSAAAVCVGALAISTLSHAAPIKGAEKVSGAFGNTIVSTYPDGRTGRLWLHEDGSYSAKGRKGDPSSGHWSVKGEKVCLKQAKPMAVPFSFCTGMGAAKVGASWDGKAVTGEKIKIRMVKGEG